MKQHFPENRGSTNDLEVGFSGDGDLPLVSIVTPSYNAGAYIRNTIESVLQQNYPKLEHIVMDGGSDDGTVDILREYPHLKWRSEKDTGQSDALNKGFNEVGGEIVGWLNADDVYAPNAVDIAVKTLTATPKVDFVCSDLGIIDESGARVGTSRGADFNLERLLSDNMIKQPTVFMRRRVIEELKGVDTRRHYVMDQEFWLRAGLQGMLFKYLPGEILASFRICKGTKTVEAGDQFCEEWMAVLESQTASDELSSESINSAMKKTSISIQMAALRKAQADKDRKRLCGAWLRLVRSHPNLVLNPGIARVLVAGLMGKRADDLRNVQVN